MVPIIAFECKNRYHLDMAHERKRIITQQILKRLKLWPALGLVGARQTGKSTLLREIIVPALAARYETFDSQTTLQRALNSPEAFCELSPNDKPLIIDEVQKCPAIFDTIKLHIDNHRIPGRYILSGSAQFSAKAGIQESLTGRIAVSQLFPLSPSELWKKSLQPYFFDEKIAPANLTLNEFNKTLLRGGMPGLCFLRSDEEFEESCLQWLETTCYRDLQRLSSVKNIDGALAFEILGEIARQSIPTAANIATKLRRDARIIKRYLELFEMIFVITPLAPHPAGVGNTEYVLLDSGIVNYFAGPRTNMLRAHILNAARAEAGAKGFAMPSLMYYRNAKQARVPLILKWVQTKNSPASFAVDFEEIERLTAHDFSSLQALKNKLSKADSMRYLFLSDTAKSYRDAFEVHPIRG